jgi:hypothetical protein
MGWGGELLTAQFLPTLSIDAPTLKPTNIEKSDGPRTGLFIDARCEQGALVMKLIMENDKITKLIWGADGDLSSLRHQWCMEAAKAKYGPIYPSNVVDVQLGFSSESRRLGMSRMLERVPCHAMRSLPSKDLPPTFFEPFGFHKRCFPLPMDDSLASYAVDDLHRIEAILETQPPPSGNYKGAKMHTETFIASLNTSANPMKWIAIETQYFSHKWGSKRREKAVQIFRASRHAELAFVGSIPRHHKRALERAEELVAPVLLANGVTVPRDLSFSE